MPLAVPNRHQLNQQSNKTGREHHGHDRRQTTSRRARHGTSRGTIPAVMATEPTKVAYYTQEFFVFLQTCQNPSDQVNPSWMHDWWKCICARYEGYYALAAVSLLTEMFLSSHVRGMRTGLLVQVDMSLWVLSLTFLLHAALLSIGKHLVDSFSSQVQTHVSVCLILFLL